MIQRLFLASWALPFVACSGLFQPLALANSGYESIARDSGYSIARNSRATQQAQLNHLSLLALSPDQAAVEPFQANCQSTDALCTAWSEFRLPHPYPTQKIATKRINAREIVLVISEPPAHLTKAEWQNLIEAIFADDLLEYRTFRWMIGVDGWVEDIVLRINNPETADDELLNHALTRDRLALLHIAMFGSSQGMSVEPIESGSVGASRARIPNLRLSAGEVSGWITDPNIGWRSLSAPAYAVDHWLAPAAAGTRQVAISADQTLVLLTFPLADIAEVRRTGTLPAALEIAFREFSVSSDVLLSGAWSSDQVAILARARQVPLADSPPLRVETFELLAAQKTRELYQSYERTNLFAGKLAQGEFANRDWAPIYLSPALVDTEFGALLNITDQMLKSWSEAGQIEYLYFSYPQKPSIFPFSGIPLSTLVYEQTGSPQVLFNWNTTGMGSVIAGNPSILIPTQTGSLPVTYGSELDGGGEIETGHLQQYEEAAYDYFANLRDPNLATVAQYTLLYQLMLAAAPVSAEFSAETTPGSEVLTDYALGFLRELDTTTGGNLARARDLVATFRQAYPDVDDSQLAALLADPRTNTLQLFGSLDREFDRLVAIEDTLVARIDAYNRRVAEFEAQQAAFNNAIDQFNAEVNRVNQQGGATPAESARLDERLASLEAERRQLEAASAELEQQSAEIDRLEQERITLGEEISETTGVFGSLVAAAQELTTDLKEFIDRNRLDTVRVAFSNAHSVTPNSWIRTPSSVLSWRNEGGRVSLVTVGGHNLDSQTLRFEESAGVNTLRVVETESGPVLQYPPNQREQILANTAALARQIEHQGITDPQVLSQTAQQPGVSRSRAAALQINEASVPQIDNRSTDVDLVRELAAVVEMNDCCIFVREGADSLAYIGYRNSNPPPAAQVTAFGDTPSLSRALTQQVDFAARNQPIVVLGDINRADAIARNLSVGLNQASRAAVDRMPWLRDLADLINLPAAPPSQTANTITVLGYGKNNTLSPLRINLGAGDGSISFLNRLLEGLSAPIRSNSAVVQEVANPAPELNLPMSWQEAANQNRLAVIQLTYVEQGTAVTPTDVYISSTVNQAQLVPAQRAEMVEAANDVIEANAGEAGNALDTLIEIREEIEQRLAPEQLELILRREQDQYYITDQPGYSLSEGGS
jgi:hypothetical protein